MAKGDRGGRRAGSAKQNKTLDSIAKKTKNLKKEQLFVVDENGNIILNKKSKDKSEVQFTVGEAREYFKNNIVLHNHPAVDGVSGTFSPEDLVSFGYGAKEIQVASVDGRYIMTNKNHGKKSQYDGWHDMQEKLNKQKATFPTGLKAKDLAKKQPNVSKLAKKRDEITNKWLKAKNSGDTKTADRYLKQFNNAQESYKKELAKETRKQTVKPYHDFYKQNASKYGFSYEFVKNK